MLSYKRQFQRAQSDVDQLRAERLACELRLSKVEMNWNNLVQQAELILPSTSQPSQNGNGRASSSSFFSFHFLLLSRFYLLTRVLNILDSFSSPDRCQLER